MDGDLSQTQFQDEVPDFRLVHLDHKDIFTPTQNGIGSMKIINKPEEAFEAFDALEEEQSRVHFVLKPELPPIPQVDDQQVFKSALLLIDNGDYELAKNLLVGCITKDPCFADALRWLGWCEKQLGDIEQAEICYEQLSILRGNPRDIYEYGEILYSLNRDDEAVQIWFQASRMIEGEDPLLFDIFKNIGNAFTRMGDFESAEENYHKALSIYPNSDVLQVNLGTLAFQQSNNKRADEHFRQACLINSSNETAWCGLALVAWAMGDFERARSLALKALDLNAVCLTAISILTQWAMEDLKFDEVLGALENYLEVRGADLDSRYSYAGLLHQAGFAEEAAEQIERILALDPQNAKATELKRIIAERTRGMDV